MEEDEVTSKKEIVYQIDQFIDGNPYVEEKVERSHAQGRAEGMQQLILDAIKEHFPALVDQVQSQIEQMQDTDTLATLFRQLLAATTERDARQILQIQENQ